jgi:cell division protein FtsL
MSRLNFLLLLLVVGCALSVISATNHQRELFIALGRAQSEEHQLAQDWSELQYRQGALSKTTLIERAAQDRLKMQPVTPGRTQYLVTQLTPDAGEGAGVNPAEASGTLGVPASQSTVRPAAQASAPATLSPAASASQGAPR